MDADEGRDERSMIIMVDDMDMNPHSRDSWIRGPRSQRDFMLPGLDDGL